jgi:hypothetical protein
MAARKNRPPEATCEDGALVRGGNAAIIQVDRRARRRAWGRFTIAHELGHSLPPTPRRSRSRRGSARITGAGLNRTLPQSQRYGWSSQTPPPQTSEYTQFSYVHPSSPLHADPSRGRAAGHSDPGTQSHVSGTTPASS